MRLGKDRRRGVLFERYREIDHKKFFIMAESSRLVSLDMDCWGLQYVAEKGLASRVVEWSSLGGHRW